MVQRKNNRKNTSKKKTQTKKSSRPHNKSKHKSSQRKSKKSKKSKMNKSSQQNFQNAENYKMNRMDQKSRKKLLDKCGLPDIPETQHCFNDSTHHTCCEIGPLARNYADSSGNPIGNLADNVFQQLPNNHPKKAYYQKTGRRPWCTCFGSKVCGKYSEKYPNDTKIRFMNSPIDDRIVNEINVHSNDTEEQIRKKFKVNSHGTPGV